MMTAHDKNWVEQMLLGWENLSKKEKKEVYKALKEAKWYWLNAKGGLEPYKGWLSLEELDNTDWEVTPEGLLGVGYFKDEAFSVSLPGGLLILSGGECGNYVFKVPELGLTYISLYEPEHSSTQARRPWLVVDNWFGFEADIEASEEDQEIGSQVKEFLDRYPDLFSLLSDCKVLKGKFLKVGDYVLISNPTELVSTKLATGDRRLLLNFQYYHVIESSRASLVPA